MRKLQNPFGVGLLTFAQDINTGADAIPFEIELSDDQQTKTILTDLDEAVGVFTFDLTDVTLFSEFFVGMFAQAIADCAFPLVE